jgi:hypothetical protein
MKNKKTPKSHWDYRVMVEKHSGVAASFGMPYYFSVREVYYKKGKPTSYGSVSTNVAGESPQEIKKDIKLMKEAFKKPILWAGDEFPKEFK